MTERERGGMEWARTPSEFAMDKFVLAYNRRSSRKRPHPETFDEAYPTPEIKLKDPTRTSIAAAKSHNIRADTRSGALPRTHSICPEEGHDLDSTIQTRLRQGYQRSIDALHENTVAVPKCYTADILLAPSRQMNKSSYGLTNKLVRVHAAREPFTLQAHYTVHYAPLFDLDIFSVFLFLCLSCIELPPLILDLLHMICWKKPLSLLVQRHLCFSVTIFFCYEYLYCWLPLGELSRSFYTFVPSFLALVLRHPELGVGGSVLLYMSPCRCLDVQKECVSRG